MLLDSSFQLPALPFVAEMFPAILAVIIQALAICVSVTLVTRSSLVTATSASVRLSMICRLIRIANELEEKNFRNIFSDNESESE